METGLNLLWSLLSGACMLLDLDVKLVTATATKTSRYRAYSNLFNSSIVGKFF